MRKQLSHAALVLMVVAGLAACSPGGGPSPTATAPRHRQPVRDGHPLTGRRNQDSCPLAVRRARDLRARAGQRRTRDHGQAIRDRHPRELHARVRGRRPGSRKPASRRRRSLPRPEDQRGDPQPRAPAHGPGLHHAVRRPATGNSDRRRGRPAGRNELQPARRLRDRRPGTPPRTSLAPPAELSKLQHLPQDDWLPRQAAHQARVRRYADPYLARRSAGKKHPVEDFLFTYYTQKPGQLLRWHPGAGVVLSGPAAAERAGWKYYRTPDDGELAAAGLPAGTTAVTVDVEAFVRDRRDALQFAGIILAGTAATAGPVRLLRAARMGHGVPAGQIRAPARVPPAAARLRTDRRGGGGEPDPLLALRCLPLLHPGRRAAEQPGAEPGEPADHGTARAACTPTWTCTSGPTSSRRCCPASW